MLDQFLKLCDKAGPDCAFHTAETATSRWNRLAKQLRAEPVDVGDGAAGSRCGPSWWWFNAACSGWPLNTDRYGGPWQTRTSAPVLVVSNRYDPATGYTGAQASATQPRGSRLLTYEGWGHTAFGRSDCVTGSVVGYLLDGTLPKPGTRCPANPNPFQTSTARTAAPAPLVGLPPTWQLAGAFR